MTDKIRVLGVLFAGLLGAFARAEAPDWLLAAAALPTPAIAAKAPATVLLDDVSVEVDAKGNATEVHRVAIRILHNSGSTRASGGVSYLGGTDKILSLGAWLIRNKETIETRKKGEWLDLATGSTGAAIDEQRTFSVSLVDQAVTGDVFGYETQMRTPLLVAQIHYEFGSDLPILTERLKVALPAGFSLEPKLYGPVVPVDTSTPDRHIWVWTVSDRPYRPTEPYEVPSARVDAEIILRIIAPAGAGGFAPHSFSNWAEVVDLYSSLNVGQCDTSPGLEAKVRELTTGAMDDLAKIKAVGAYVQKLRYIAINTGLRYGFGWKARKASAVFFTGYGDCKDKANLMVSMLRQAGLRAHLVSAFLGKEREVRPDCPTPEQFNHAIVAIQVDDKVQLPAVVTADKLGRLLIFDPTDAYTQVGDVSQPLQGGLVHVEAPGNNVLTALPVFLPQEDFKIDRQMQMQLSPDGTLTVTGKISATGQTGASLRAQFEAANLPKDLEQLVTKQLNEKFRGAAVHEKQTADDRATGRSTLSFTCAQPNYLQWLEGQAAVVKLDILSRHYLPNFSAKERLLPIQLPPMAINDEIVLSIPSGFQVGELPAQTSLDSPYGSCRITYEIVGQTLKLKRLVILNQTSIPTADYAKLRQFLSDLAKADRTSLLLKKQG